ncbi:MAG: hypothetical protein RSE41_03890 [Clostridia bacterium]
MAKKEDILKSFVEEQEINYTAPVKELSLQNEIGWIRLKVGDFPSKGLFYPEGTEVAIKAATAAEIRHWSVLVEDDLNQVDEMLNYILERCVTVKLKEGFATWKDLIEIDRFYVILAVRELTFKSENPIKVKISDTEDRPLIKEMISFANFDEEIMRFYSAEYRCFELKFKNGTTHYLGMPTIGVVNWLKKYVIDKQQNKLKFDEDFVGFAPFLINEWRGLTNKNYEDLVIDSHGWTLSEVSVFTKFKEKIVSSVNPQIVYNDEHGMEVRVPLNFCDGIKSLFIISNAFDELL